MVPGTALQGATRGLQWVLVLQASAMRGCAVVLCVHVCVHACVPWNIPVCHKEGGVLDLEQGARRG